jgi:hypothetical protein
MYRSSTGKETASDSVMYEASGLTWYEAISEELVNGTELSNKKLAEALLHNKTKFTSDEWEDFGINELKREHFIKCGDKYYKPAEITKLEARKDRRKREFEKEERRLKQREEALRDELPDYVKKLILGYELRTFYFEIIESFRKLAIVCLPVFFRPSGSASQLMFGLMVCFLTFGLHVLYKPYDHSGNDWLAMLCQVNCQWPPRFQPI